MTVKTAALTRQHLEGATVVVPRRRYQGNALVAFAALVGIVEVAWLVLLIELVSRFA